MGLVSSCRFLSSLLSPTENFEVLFISSAPLAVFPGSAVVPAVPFFVDGVGFGGGALLRVASAGFLSGAVGGGGKGAAELRFSRFNASSIALM